MYFGLLLIELETLLGEIGLRLLDILHELFICPGTLLEAEHMYSYISNCKHSKQSTKPHGKLQMIQNNQVNCHRGYGVDGKMKVGGEEGVKSEDGKDPQGDDDE